MDTKVFPDLTSSPQGQDTPQTGSPDASLLRPRRARCLPQLDLCAAARQQISRQPQQREALSAEGVAADNLRRLARLKMRHGASDETSRLLRFLEFVQQNGNYHLLLGVRRAIRLCEAGKTAQEDLQNTFRQMMIENDFY